MSDFSVQWSVLEALHHADVDKNHALNELKFNGNEFPVAIDKCERQNTSINVNVCGYDEEG